jgi:hypothetical protein
MISLVAVAVLAFNSWADLSAQFQTTANDQEFLNYVPTVDLNCSGCVLKYKDTGTSVGMKLKVNGEKAGKWVPKCSATNPEAQVVAYHLGRFLGMSHVVMPSAYMELKGEARNKFKAMLNQAQERNRWRRENKDITLQALNSGAALVGVFTPNLEGGSPEVKNLANSSANTINSAHPIAKFIKANGPVPSPGRMMTLDGVKLPNQPAPQENELELAKQFSQIMVLDMLCGEWDRWSGGNVEATIENGKMFFISRDNGGASMRGVAHMAKYKNIVTRFDRNQIERVKTLVELLSNPATSSEMVKLLEIRTANHSLLERAKDILQHVKNQNAAHGERAFF